MYPKAGDPPLRAIRSKGGSVFGEAKPMVGAIVYTTIGLLRKRAATHAEGLARIFLTGLALYLP